MRCAGKSPRLSGVELHANVPDVRPYLADCGLLVVPLRIGGGSRLKILEALASGTPVVSTRSARRDWIWKRDRISLLLRISTILRGH